MIVEVHPATRRRSGRFEVFDASTFLCKVTAGESPGAIVSIGGL
jgi:hypothetical protein